MARRNNLNWVAYQDGDRIIIGPREWQGRGVSLTHGIYEADKNENVETLLRRAAATPIERCNALRRSFDTWDRFEAACDAGRYGPEW